MGHKQAARKYFFTARSCADLRFYGFALLEKFVGKDPLGQAVLLHISCYRATFPF